MIWLIVLGSIAGYVFLAGLVGRLFHLSYAVKYLDSYDETPASWIVGGLWPISFIAIAGIIIATKMADVEGRERRLATKHTREMERLAAEQENLRLSLQYLKTEGVDVGNVDIYEPARKLERSW